MNETVVPRYGVVRQGAAGDEVQAAAERIRLAGFAVLGGGYDEEHLATLSDAFDRGRAASVDRHGGPEALSAIGEQHVFRAPLAHDRVFFGLAKNQRVIALCRALIGDYIVLSQQNGVINPPNGASYGQGAYHRDLPYQHFTSSRPLAVNALFCLDDFTADNGATFVVPGSHRSEEFPSDGTVSDLAQQVTAPAGSFIVLDAMAYHRGGVNRTGRPRRAVNHVYTIPLIRQQLDLEGLLGDGFTSNPDERRLLGYGLRTPASLEEYYARRRAMREP